MERLKGLKERYQTVNQALSCINEAVELRRANKEKPLENKHFRNSEIQCFEFSVETFWKFLKEYLSLIHEIEIEFVSPKTTFEAAFKVGIIDEQEYQHLIAIIKARNLTSHTYNEEFAEILSQRIPSYYETIKTILDRMKI